MKSFNAVSRWKWPGSRTKIPPSGLRFRNVRSGLRCDLSHVIPEAQLLVLLARTSVNGTLQVEIQDRLRDRVDWTVLWQLAQSHGVTSLVYRTLASHGPGVVPPSTMEGFRRHMQANAIASHLLGDELIVLGEAFAAKGIRVLPFKGPTLAMTAYGDLALRECVGLDLIVERSSIPQARQLLWSHGYQLASPAGAHEEEQHEAVHSFTKKNGLFQVHLRCDLARGLFTFRLDREDLWNRLKPVRLGQRTIMGPSPEELLILLCVHGTQYAWENLRSICDVAELVRRRRTLDWSRVSFLSHQWGCRRMLLMGLALAHALFDAPLSRPCRDAIETDRDIRDLVKKMPKRLLRAQEEGVDEADVDALCLTLKDSWVEQCTYGLALCHAEVPLATKSLLWFRFRRRLNILYQVVHQFRRAVLWCTSVLRVKQFLLRWLESPGRRPV